MTTEPLRLLIFGGRTWSEWEKSYELLDKAIKGRPVDYIINGGATGADMIGRRWALDRELPVVTHPARWKALGRRAGPTRNGAMLAKWSPNAAVGFPGGPGTANMHKRLVDAGVPVWLPFGLGA